MSSPVKQDKHAEEEAKMLSEIAKLNTLSIRCNKFRQLIDDKNVDLGRLNPPFFTPEQLRKISWSGIPDEIRHFVWKLLLGYTPCNTERREATIQRKRKEYEEYIQQNLQRDPALNHQIDIDIKRTQAGVKLYQNEKVRESLIRVLYIWAIRHPASGYVQGINDLLIPFFHVFLGAALKIDLDQEVDPALLENLLEIEADCFWCLTKLLDGIQDHYTFAQPGIQRQVGKLKELIGRIDAPLSQHFQKQGIEFIQIAFRWMNCLLTREMSLKRIIRMWDTYLSEGIDGFSTFHLYVCAAFLVKWSERLRKMEFGDIMMFLQSIDKETKNWEDKDVELLLSEAFMWKSLFEGSPSHLNA